MNKPLTTMRHRNKAKITTLVKNQVKVDRKKPNTLNCECEFAFICVLFVPICIYASLH